MEKACFEITGICSGDYESATMDVTKDEYVRLCGEEPYEKSYFYKGRYMYYGFDIPKEVIKNFKTGDVLKIKAVYEIERVGHEEGSDHMLDDDEWNLK